MSIINIIIQGALTGLFLTISFGAGFFALIQTSINNGYRKGLFIALGAMLGDVLFIGMAVFATSFVKDELPKYSQAIKAAAMIGFIIMGLISILKSSKVIDPNAQAGKKPFYYISKGFLLNVINPIILITWLGITIYLESTLNYNFADLFLYFGSVMVATFLAQLAVCFFSHKIKTYLSNLFIHRLNILVGIIFIAVGIFLYFGSGDATTEMERASELLK